MNDFFQQPRLYAITGESFHPGRELLTVMEEALQGGASIVQLRDKHASKEVMLAKAKALRELTAKYGAMFIVNDDVEVALRSEADGVHLGQGDMPLSAARRLLGPKRVIGISTHAIEEARRAQEDGADYIGAGPVFATKTKEDVVAPVTTDYIRQVAAEISIPFVAIGGIKLHNVDDVLQSGAKHICAVSEIVGSRAVRGTCEALLSKIKQANGGKAHGAAR